VRVMRPQPTTRRREVWREDWRAGVFASVPHPCGHLRPPQRPNVPLVLFLLVTVRESTIM